MENPLVIKFDGGDADRHSVDMRLLGECLVGVERIVSTILISAHTKRLPKKGERAPLIIKAHEPAAGTVTIPISIQEASGLLQLGYQILGTKLDEILAEWFRTVFMFHSGKTSEAEVAMHHVAELAVIHAQAFEAMDERRHEEVMGMQRLLSQGLERLGGSAVQAVAPVGPSVRRLWLFSGRQPRLTVNEDDANAIREKADLVWDSQTRYTIRTDGFVFHTRKLSIEHPEHDGWFSAEIVDPIAEIEANPYASAAQRKALIKVVAKAGHRGDVLERFVISDFIEEVGAAA